MSSTDQTYYRDGHDASISLTHSWRNVKNSCAYMLNFIKPTDKILDVGCGPGTITYDLGKYVPKGEIIGIEPTKELIDEALRDETTKKSQPNVSFEVCSVYSLPYPDSCFDIVHAHQVIVHLENPLKALQEMKRVLKPGGYICCRDGDLQACIFYPEVFKEPLFYYLEKATTEFTCWYGGSRLKELFIGVKFKPDKIIHTTSTWCISSRADRELFSNMYIKRLDSIKYNSSDKYTKSQLKEAWLQWANDDKASWVQIHGEVIAQK
ncbi:hypothetical protein WICANDRAFT_36397 [Wickerhamomyces anomalus NRRL Y-366-8]|uniref:Methyltransferase domain-containing protein n=1 Tax=Wickerhamomyces anomalus (strain ATCC 58044 / CBS 1984 / NCYC 433 / NRRL Y-366-8) TaxID=683960 RepID=A0A1E3NV15_WICAA|nr:uncharacterized protein WICANDRAFT_36397 [Wickerhamomyces anomalus NRRL Y-366-8]ODQ56933.1 hypothetical protein WICANDRAFT_36397 [Wickerhamomyces anomalus NRRL Y-366-8]